MCGVVSNSFCLLDNSADKFQSALLLKFEPHSGLPILLHFVCIIGASQKKAVGFIAHGLSGNQLFYNFSDDLKTMG